MKDFLAEKRGDYYVSMSLLTCNGKLSVVGYDGKEVITEMMFNIVNERANCILDKPQVAKPQQGKTKGSEKPWISFPTEKEATNFLHFITRNKTFRAIYIIQKHDQNAANNMLGFLPWLDWSEEWTDDRTYKHFGFTDKEIACIENITKLVNLA